MIKVVAFDFDGTLVPSMEAYGRFAACIISSVYDVSEENAYRQYMNTSGLPFPEQLEIIAPGGKHHLKLVHEFEQGRHTVLHQTAPEIDAAEVFDALIKKGIAPVISSNNTEPLLNEYAQRHHLNAAFILGYRGPNFSKGADHFRFIYNQYGVKNEEIVFVADSLTDVEIAMKECVPFIGKAGTFTRLQFHDKLPNCDVIDHLSELLSRI